MVKGQSLPLLLCKTRYVYGKSYVIALNGTYVNKIHLYDVFYFFVLVCIIGIHYITNVYFFKSENE